MLFVVYNLYFVYGVTVTIIIMLDYSISILSFVSSDVIPDIFDPRAISISLLFLKCTIATKRRILDLPVLETFDKRGPPFIFKRKLFPTTF